MCGICGIVDTKLKIDQQTIKKMMQLMKHRGPDDDGMLLEGRIGLGHVRLSIIDLSEKGHQPMANDDETLWIVYNGEIYNYIELREELKGHGMKFRSKSDTEVLLKAYEVWGNDCLPKLNGMFAFVIYDKNSNKLFGARDRFGIKPFYFHESSDRFIFSSEIKPILSTGIKPEPFYQNIYDFILYQQTGPFEFSFFENIKKLFPGHYMELDLNSLKASIHKWWELNIDIKDVAQAEVVDNIKKLFKDSVRIRLRSDVPVGSCLSGGLDSSSIVCNMVDIQGTSKNINTFSSIYSFDFSGNEKKFINDVVEKTSVNGYEIEPTPEDMIKELERVIYFQEEPFCGLSPFAQWEVMKLAHRHDMKVLLDGQGGDETLAGYTGYIGMYSANLLARARFFKMHSELKKYKQLHGTRYPLMDILYPLVPGAIKRRARRKKSHYLSDDFLGKTRGTNHFSEILRFRPLSVILKDSMRFQVLELLRYEDKNSMAFSIETRLPFLDYRLVNYLFTIPDDLKLRDGKTKFIFREAIKGLVPDEIYDRHDKVGFVAPESHWLKNEKVWKYITDIITSPTAISHGIFTKEGVNRLLEEYKSGGKIEPYIIWSLVILELWFRIFFDNGYEKYDFSDNYKKSK